MDLKRNVFCVMGLPIDAIDTQGAVQRVRHAAFSNTRCFISTPNLNFVVAASTDAAFRDSVLHSDLSLPDGMPLVWVARLLGLPIRERVSGSGLFEQLQQHAGPPLSVYFFGGPEGAAEAAARRVNERGGGLRCVGFDAPGFGSIQEMSQQGRIERINRSGAQFVIVALGAKKGQAWIEHNRGHLTAPVLCHLGAVMNFAAGTVRRAPRWLQSIGAEWLWRIREERTLARRYWADGVALIGMLMRNVLPLAVTLRLNRPMAKDLAQARVVVDQVTGQTTLELKGAWQLQNLAPLRQALHEVTTSPASVALNMAGVTHVDCAFLGLLMQFSGALSLPAHLFVRNAAPSVAQVFHLAGAQFVLSPHPQS